MFSTAALNLAIGIGVYRLLARPDEHFAAHAKEKVVMTPGNVSSTLPYPSLLLVGFALSATSWTIQAAPKTGQDADPCGTMTLTHTGVRTGAMAGCF